MTKYQDLKERFWNKVDLWFGITDEDCWNWTGSDDGRGYGYMKLRQRRSGKKAHHISFWLKHGKWPSFLLRHTCDNRRCINPSHLLEGNYQDNANDKVNRDRCPLGSNHVNSKLTEQQVIEIHNKLCTTALRQIDIAIQYGVERSAVSSIKIGRTWSHITGR